MTPATYSTLHRWRHMLLRLLGEQVPLPPPIPGRRHEIRTPADSEPLELVDGELPTATELGLILGVSREGARQRLERARSTGDTAALLRPRGRAPRARRGDGDGSPSAPRPLDRA